MSKIFNPDNKDKLESPERYRILPPRETLLDLGLIKNDIMADIGAGTGFFAMPAAEIVGNKGTVFAVDISEEMLKNLKARINASSLRNIQLVHSDPYDFKLPSGCASFVMAALVVHEADDTKRFLKEACRILKVDGTLAIIDWQKKEMDQGPPIEHRVDESTIIMTLTEIGFSNITAQHKADRFYSIVVKK